MDIRERDAVKVKGLWRFVWWEDGQEVRVQEEENLVVASGLSVIASLLVYERTNNLPWFLAWGTNTTPAANDNVKLGNESSRKLVSTKDRSANTVARIRTFLLKSEAVGLWREWGLFVAGTSEIGSGTLFNRILPAGGTNKTGNQVLTVQVDISFSAG